MKKTIDDETGSIDFECFIGSSEGNGSDFSELGLLDSPSGGNLFVITNFPAENKSALLEWLIDIVIEIKKDELNGQEALFREKSGMCMKAQNLSNGYSTPMVSTNSTTE